MNMETQFSAGGSIRSGRAPNPTGMFLNPRRRKRRRRASRPRRKRNEWRDDSLGHAMVAYERHNPSKAEAYRDVWEVLTESQIAARPRGKLYTYDEVKKLRKGVQRRKKKNRVALRGRNNPKKRKKNPYKAASPKRRRRRRRRTYRTSNPSPMRTYRRRAGRPRRKKRVVRRRRRNNPVELKKPVQLVDAGLGFGMGWGFAGFVDTLSRGTITRELTKLMGGRTDRAAAVWSGMSLALLWAGTKMFKYTRQNRAWILGGALGRTIFHGLNATLPTTGFGSTLRSVMALPSTGYTAPASNERRVVLDATSKQLKDASTGQVVTAKVSGTDYVDAQGRKLIDNRDGKALTAEDLKEFGITATTTETTTGSTTGGVSGFPGGYGSFPGGYGVYAYMKPSYQGGSLGRYAYMQPGHQGGSLGRYAYLQPGHQGGSLGGYVANSMPVPQQRLYAGESHAPVGGSGFSGNGASNAARLGLAGGKFGSLKRSF